MKLINFTKQNYDILNQLNPPLFKNLGSYENFYKHIKNENKISKWIENLPNETILNIVFLKGKFRFSFAMWLQDITVNNNIDGINIQNLKTIKGENWHDEVMIFKSRNCLSVENPTWDEKVEIDI